MTQQQGNLPNPKTRMTPQWIQQAVAQNPITKLGEWMYRTCPVRLGFVNLLERGKPDKDAPPGTEGKYGATLLFPTGADLTMLRNDAAAFAAKEFPEKCVGGQFYGLRFPFRDQGEKALKYEGYVPGAIFFNATANYKPQVVVPGPLLPDGTRVWNPVVDKAKVYAGVWAIVTINLYAGRNSKNPGVSFGINNVVLIADDEQFGGAGGTDPARDFAGVQIDAATDFSAVMAGAPVAPIGGMGQPVNPMSIMPAAQQVQHLPAQPGMPATTVVQGYPQVQPVQQPVQTGMPVYGLPTQPAQPATDIDLASVL